MLSSEYGRRKPDPAIFHYAARLAKVPTSECIYIGDRIARDVVGAKRAGFHMAIQIAHDFQHGEQDEGAQTGCNHPLDDRIDRHIEKGNCPSASELKGNKRQTKIRAIVL